MEQLGCYGKLPCTGDFFHRNLPSAVIQSWEHWLQQGLFHSQKQLGEQWREYYLTCPFWRFYLPAGLIADEAYAGVMCPSVDSVGRYFPVTVMLALPTNASIQVFSGAFQQFLEHIEDTILAALDQQIATLDDFMAQCAQATLLVDTDSAPLSPGTQAQFQFQQGWQPADVAAAWLLANQPASHSWWWCEGNHQRPGSLMQTQGLPALEVFNEMLSGAPSQQAVTLPTALEMPIAVDERSQQPQTAPQLPEAPSANFVPSPNPAATTPVASEPVAPEQHYRPEPITSGVDHDDPLAAATLLGDDPTIDLSPTETTPAVSIPCDTVYMSETGPVRGHNEDSLLARPEANLWVVADGMGGHSFGEFASREITSQLSQLTPQGNLIERVHQVQETLQSVNERVLNFSIEKNITCGSTVVAALCEGHQFAVIWAGDSRLYRYRHGSLEQLTRDHDGSELNNSADSMTSPGDVPGAKSTNLISRAVGVTRTLDTDIHYFPVDPGDRLLLCSDGVYGPLASNESLQRVFDSQKPLEETLHDLEQAILAAGADDNYSAVLLDVPRNSDQDDSP